MNVEETTTEPGAHSPGFVLPERNHFSIHPLQEIRNSPQPVPLRDRYIAKPAGLWYGVGDGWREFCRDNGWLRDYRHVYEVTVDHSRILVLDSFGKFFEFEEEYLINPFPELSMRTTGVPDWPRVAKKYSGIEITAPKTIYYHLECAGIWVSGWDVASGCVWDTSAITVGMKLE